MNIKITFAILTLMLLIGCTKALKTDDGQKLLLEIQKVSSEKKIDCGRGLTSEEALKVASENLNLNQSAWAKYIETKAGQAAFLEANTKWIANCEKNSKNK